MEWLIQFIEKHPFLFSWLDFFYPQAIGVPIAYKLSLFFPQKILRINGNIPWPVHHSSRVFYRKNITMGSHCAPGMSLGCYIQARNGINLGNNVFFGPGVGLISSGHCKEDYYHFEKTGPIVIGDDVWVGMNSVILPGVNIGNNVIIGAGSVVTHNIKSDSIAVGNPCKVIKKKSTYTGQYP